MNTNYIYRYTYSLSLSYLRALSNELSVDVVSTLSITYFYANARYSCVNVSRGVVLYMSVLR